MPRRDAPARYLRTADSVESGNEQSERVKRRLRAGLASVAEAIQSSRDSQRLVELSGDVAGH